MLLVYLFTATPVLFVEVKAAERFCWSNVSGTSHSVLALPLRSQACVCRWRNTPTRTSDDATLSCCNSSMYAHSHSNSVLLRRWRHMTSVKTKLHESRPRLNRQPSALWIETRLWKSQRVITLTSFHRKRVQTKSIESSTTAGWQQGTYTDSVRSKPIAKMRYWT